MNRRHMLMVMGSLPLMARAAAQAPLAVVYKTPTCGCCGIWVTHLEKNGFKTQVHELDDLTAIKQRFGVPAALGSCHTAEIGGYFVEGHVPAADVQRLLRERPKAKGLAVPGMPLGSPGMEVPSGRVDRYEVMLVGSDGQATVFATHGG